MASNNEYLVDKDLPNGLGAAAILAAGIGCAVLGVLALLGDAFKSIQTFLNFYNPTGTLSGVSTLAVLAWLASWYLLASRWRGRDVNISKVSALAFSLLAVGLLLTFPPVMDLLQGK